MGDPTDFRNFMGAVIDERAFKTIRGYIAHARRDRNSKVIIGGGADARKGYFIEPTVVRASRPEVRLMREEIRSLSQPGREQEAASAAPRVRALCSDLAIRATHAAVTLYKGAALLASHPAQRLAREAMFLLVWSSPNPVIDRTVELLSKDPAGRSESADEPSRFG